MLDSVRSVLLEEQLAGLDTKMPTATISVKSKILKMNSLIF